MGIMIRSLAGLLFLLLLAVVAGAAFASEFKQPPVVAIMPADPRGPLLARFAMLVYSLNRGRNAKLEYVGVSDCDQRPDKDGVRYQMVVTAVNASGATVRYRAVVWGIPKTSEWMLLQFRRVERSIRRGTRTHD